MKSVIKIYCDFSNEGAEWTELQIRQRLIDSRILSCCEELDNWQLIWASGEENGKPVYFTPQLVGAWMTDDPEATRLMEAYDGKMIFKHPPLDALTLQPIRKKTILIVELTTNERENTCRIIWKRDGKIMYEKEETH